MIRHSAFRSGLGRGSLLASCLWFGLAAHAGLPQEREPVIFLPEPAACAEHLIQAHNDVDDQDTKLRAVEELIAHVPFAFPGQDIENSPQFKLAKQYLLPGLRYRTPLVVNALVGAANMGKSKIFNSILAQLEERRAVRPSDLISTSDIEAGTTLRPVLLAAPHAADGVLRRDLTARFVDIDVYRGPGQTREDGKALLHQMEGLAPYQKQVWVDGADNSVGDPNVDSGPINLERAQRTFLPADVFYVAFSQDNYRNYAERQTLGQNFKTFGARKSVMIMRVNRTADPREPGGASIAHLQSYRKLMLHMANVMYGLPEDTPEFPPQVLGTYVIYIDNAVADDRRHPEFVPIGDTPGFPVLVEQIDRTWSKIKGDGISAASSSLVTTLEGQLAGEIKKIHVTQIYEAAIQALANDLAQMMTIDFPYETAARMFRQAFARRNKASAALDKAFAGAFEPQRRILESKLLSFLSTEPATIEKINGEIASRVEAATSVVAFALGELRTGRVPLLKDGPSAERIRNMITAYNALYPDDTVKPSARTLDHFRDADERGVTIIDLPSEAYLTAEARAELAAVTDRKARVLANAIVRDAAGRLRSAIDDKMMAQGLGRIAAGEYDDYNAMWKYAPPTIDVGGMTGSGWLAKSYVVKALAVKAAATKAVVATAAAASTPILLPVAVGVGGFYLATVLFRSASNGTADKLLAPRMNAWYRDLQQRRFRRGSIVGFSGLLRELRHADQVRGRHLKEVQHAIGVLNPDFTPVRTQL